MPYKERAKVGQLRKRPKPPYKVRNWSAYNRSLANRGRVSFYFPGGDIRAAFINDHEYVEGLSGKQVRYLDAYIEALFMLKVVFRLALRQVTGFAQEYFQRVGLDLRVPCFGHLCDRFAQLKPSVQIRAATALKRLKEGQPVDLIVDSSGLKLDQTAEWHAVKHRNGKHRRNWGKLHIGQTPEGDILVAALTDSSVSDTAILDQFLASGLPLNKVIADGAYYQIERNAELIAQGVTPVILPPSDAVVHDKPGYEHHDRLVQYIEKKGVYAFHKKYGYGVRAKVESQFSRLKRCLGETLHTRRTTSRENEGRILVNVLNLWNSFGRAEYIKMA